MKRMGACRNDLFQAQMLAVARNTVQQQLENEFNLCSQKVCDFYIVNIFLHRCTMCKLGCFWQCKKKLAWLGHLSGSSVNPILAKIDRRLF